MSNPRRRLDQLLASLGYGSRSEVRRIVAAGRVTVAGAPAAAADAKVFAADVRVDGAPLDHPDGLFLVLHKPEGVVCSHDPREGRRIYDLLPAGWLLRNPAPVSVGRLDKDSSGLLLVTDDLPLVHRLTSPRHKVPKTYAVTLDAPGDLALVTAFASGTLHLAGEDEPCAPAELRLGPGATAEVVMTEGRFRQVRRMFAHFGREVRRLHRTQFGPWVLGDLPEGAWREAERPGAC